MEYEISEQRPLILGSASPRRRELLENLRIPFRVVTAMADESQMSGEPASEYLRRVVRNKLRAVCVELSSSPEYSSVLVADTIVLLDDEILGKPLDTADAVRLLSRLSGRTHRVRTRYLVAVRGAGEPTIERTVESSVTMREATSAEIERYAASGEGLDKAGAYAVQGLGAFLVKEIDGSWSNVVGLPVCELVADLRDAGILESFPFVSSRC